MKVLIVDDSVVSVRRLADLAEWAELGVEEVLTAHHAIKARSILEKTPVDILICDVEMPKENGLSLAAWAHGLHPSLSLIFLDEALRETVLQEALRLKAEVVLVKPVDTKCLLDTVERLVRKKQNEKQIEATCRVGAYWMARREFLEDLFWRDAVSQPADPVLENVQYYADLQQIRFDPHSLYSLVLVAAEKTEVERMEAETGNGWPALQDLARELLLEPDHARRVVSFPDYFVLVSERLNQKELEEGCLSLIQKSRQQFQIRLCCYVWIGALYQEFYRDWQFLHQIKEDDIEQREPLVFVSDQDDLPDAPLPSDYTLPASFGHLLYSGEEEKFFREYHAFLENRKKQAPLSLRFLKKLQKDLLQCFLVVLERKELYAHQLPDILFKFPARKLSDLEGQLRCFFWQLRQANEASQERSSISAILIRYIDGHLSEPISRECLSKLVGLSSDYMSRIFKQETGISLKEFIIEARLQKALHLLLTS